MDGTCSSFGDNLASPCACSKVVSTPETKSLSCVTSHLQTPFSSCLRQIELGNETGGGNTVVPTRCNLQSPLAFLSYCDVTFFLHLRLYLNKKAKQPQLEKPAAPCRGEAGLVAALATEAGQSRRGAAGSPSRAVVRDHRGWVSEAARRPRAGSRPSSGPARPPSGPRVPRPRLSAQTRSLLLCGPDASVCLALSVPRPRLATPYWTGRARRAGLSCSSAGTNGPYLKAAAECRRWNRWQDSRARLVSRHRTVSAPTAAAEGDME